MSFLLKDMKKQYEALKKSNETIDPEIIERIKGFKKKELEKEKRVKTGGCTNFVKCIENGKTYASVKDAAKDLKISYNGTITKLRKGVKAYGYTFEKVKK